MGPRFEVWFELTSDDSHARFEELADRFCTDFDATITEQYPSGFHDGDKEYWTLLMDGKEFMLMRLRGAGTAIGGQGGNRIHELIQIANEMGVKKRVGWRWRLWEVSNAIRSMFSRRQLRTDTD